MFKPFPGEVGRFPFRVERDACWLSADCSPHPRGAGWPRRCSRSRAAAVSDACPERPPVATEPDPKLDPPAPREASVQAVLRQGGSSFLDPPAPREASVQADLRQGGSSFDPLSTPLEWPRSLCSSQFPARSADSLLGSKETRAGCGYHPSAGRSWWGLVGPARERELEQTVGDTGFVRRAGGDQPPQCVGAELVAGDGREERLPCKRPEPAVWSAVTVAVRGTSSISASSPKTSPGPSSRMTVRRG